MDELPDFDYNFDFETDYTKLLVPKSFYAQTAQGRIKMQGYTISSCKHLRLTSHKPSSYEKFSVWTIYRNTEFKLFTFGTKRHAAIALGTLSEIDAKGIASIGISPIDLSQKELSLDELLQIKTLLVGLLRHEQHSLKDSNDLKIKAATRFAATLECQSLANLLNAKATVAGIGEAGLTA